MMGNRFEVETADIKIADFVDQSTLDLGEDIFGHGEDKIRGGKIRRSNLPDPLQGINSSINDELRAPVSDKLKNKANRIGKKANSLIDPTLIKVAKVEEFLSKIESSASKRGFKLPEGFISSAGDVLESIKKYGDNFKEEISSAVGRLNGEMVECSGETRPLEVREVRDVPTQVLTGIETLKCAASRGEKELVDTILDTIFGDGTKRAVMMAAVNEAARNGDVSAVAILSKLPLAHELISDSPNLPFNLINGIKDHYTRKEKSNFEGVMDMLDAYGEWGDKTGGTITRGHINKHKLDILEKKVRGLLPVADLTDPIAVQKPAELQYLYGTLVV